MPGPVAAVFLFVSAKKNKIFFNCKDALSFGLF
jgi:hypothetical protein